MKETTFFIVVGFLAATSLISGILGLAYAKSQDKKREEVPTFDDLYEDNFPAEDASPDLLCD